jgi:hypothetical protein
MSQATHVPSNSGKPIPCTRETHGSCRICELIDPEHPDYAEATRRLFHPEAFGGEPSRAGEPVVEAVPKAQWPFGIAAVAMFARPGDRGIGDTVARTIGPIGGDLFKEWWKKITGTDCGCGGRQEHLNAAYPY